MNKAYLCLLLLVAPAVAMECGTGCYEYNHTCACEEKPESTPSVKPSDEKPPRSGRQEVSDGAMPQSLIYQDAKQDQDRQQADAAGKRAAGIN